MQNITVKLEVVTPLFLGGAEPRGEPELRSPAFRGAMRYWLMAALGASTVDNPEGIKEVQKSESEVFYQTSVALTS